MRFETYSANTFGYDLFLERGKVVVPEMTDFEVLYAFVLDHVWKCPDHGCIVVGAETPCPRCTARMAALDTMTYYTLYTAPNSWF